MIIFILIFLMLATGLLGAYTMRFQQSTLILGKKLAPDNPFLPTGLQDAITPKMQTMRSIVYGILLLVIFIYGMIFYIWYWGLGFAIVTFLIVTPILKLIFPKAGSDFYIKRIKRDLNKRLDRYKKSGDQERETAAGEIISKFDILK